jgi:hypothetical protein
MSIPVIDKLKTRQKGEVIVGNELKLQDGEIALIFRPGVFGPDILTTVEQTHKQLVMPEVIEGSPFIMTAMINMLFYGGPNCQQARHFCIDQTLAVMSLKGISKELAPDTALPN